MTTSFRCHLTVSAIDTQQCKSDDIPDLALKSTLDWALVLPQLPSRAYRSVSCTRLDYVDLRMMCLIAWVLRGRYDPEEMESSIQIPFASPAIDNLMTRRPLTISVRQTLQYFPSGWGSTSMMYPLSCRKRDDAFRCRKQTLRRGESVKVYVCQTRTITTAEDGMLSRQICSG